MPLLSTESLLDDDADSPGALELLPLILLEGACLAEELLPPLREPVFGGGGPMDGLSVALEATPPPPSAEAPDFFFLVVVKAEGEV